MSDNIHKLLWLRLSYPSKNQQSQLLVGMSYPKSTEFRGNPQAINLGKQAEEQDRAHRQRNMGECNTIYVPPLEEDEMQYSPKMDLI